MQALASLPLVAPLALNRLAQRGSFPFWSPYKEVLKGSAFFASGELSVTLQAANFALLNVTKLNRDDLIFRLARWAAEGDRF
jgi:hypothetical protein